MRLCISSDLMLWICLTVGIVINYSGQLVLATATANAGYVDNGDTKVCIGTKSRLSVPSNKTHHYRNLRDRYTNCTYVDGNLELTWLHDPNLDLSFLANIREITGYILISHVDVTKVVFPKLQIIRGRTLFSLNENDGKYALFAAYSKMHTLEMPELREILAGWVGFINNYNLCHTRTIVWREILSDPNNSYNYTYNFTASERTCPNCDDSCQQDACWGEGPQNCQKFSKITCAPQCSQGRCFGPGPRDCCHLFCAGGCTGPTQKDCIACKNFFDDGVCKEECPPMRKYNPSKYALEANPEGKYAYGATCVRECPGHLLKDNGACVRSCPSDKMAKDGECVACNGPCPKTCPGVNVLHSGNIDSFKNCTVIEGNIRVLDQTFSGFQDISDSYRLGARYLPMHPDRLNVFSTVKEITGYLNIEGVHEHFTNLSYFRNLEVIHGRSLIESYFAALSIVKSSVSSLELHSLKRINSGNIVIQHNKNLCFVTNILWSNVQHSNEQKQFINENLNASECQKLGLVCSDQCNSDGCWGSGPDQCLNCKSFNYSGTCYADCRNQGYLKPLMNKAVCRKCHPRCELCTNYGFHEQMCSKCVGYKKAEQCEDECPGDHYADEEKRECFKCHAECKGCTGPGADDCLACVNFKLFNESEVYDNSTLFNCTSKCPREQPHINYQSMHIGPHCVSTPPRNSKLSANVNINMIIIIVVPVSVDNPEYLLNALSGADAPIPTQTIGIPVAGVPSTLEVKVPGSESTSSDHEYYNDTQRELQPLQLLRSRNTETRV
ncbi:Egfr [Drosophila busckii]|uniref:receptor protein-tyrosine kinase n=1 Tax=Drosophila busckii TaxID=30019 RepID=A0A0M4EEW8_DROBS|nr:Egfr [Drosophila busckii]